MATGRKQVAPRTTIASEWGNAVWDQSVQTFASIADRNTQFPTPKRGASCMLDTHPGIVMVYDGAAWMGRQYTRISVTTNGSGEAIINFQYVFTGNPAHVLLQAWNTDGTWVNVFGVKAGYPNAAGIILAVINVRNGLTPATGGNQGVVGSMLSYGPF